jgi:hypothetical protein
MPTKKNKKKNKKGNEEEISPEQLEFNDLWISYQILHDRLSNKVKKDELSTSGKFFFSFFLLWTLFMSSYDFSTGWRATSDLAIMEALIYPSFQSSHSSTGTSTTTFSAAERAALKNKTIDTNNNNNQKNDTQKVDSTYPHFITFKGIQSIEDYNIWLEDVFLEDLFIKPEKEAQAKGRQFGQLHYHQSLLWGVSIRQHRVSSFDSSSKGCCIPSEMQHQMECNPRYGVFGDAHQYNSPSVKDTKGFGQWYYDQQCLIKLGIKEPIINENEENPSAAEECAKYQWNYGTEKELEDSAFTFDYLSTGVDCSYDGGGYRIIIPKNVVKAKEIMYEILGKETPCKNRSITTSIISNITDSIESQKKCHGKLVSLMQFFLLGESMLIVIIIIIFSLFLKSPFVDKNTRMVVVTIQTYTVNTNIVLKANIIAEFDSSGRVGTTVHFHTDASLLDSILPQPAEAWHIIVRFCMVIMGKLMKTNRNFYIA